MEIIVIVVIVGLAALVSIVFAKVNLYRSERLQHLSDACASISDEGKRKELEDALHAMLKDSFERSSASFVEYYRQNVSQPGRVLYIIGSLAVLVTISFAFVRSLVEIILPTMNSLAADTVVAGQYGFLPAMIDAGQNMSIAVAVAMTIFPPGIWLFFNIGKRVPVAFRIVLGKEVAEPARTKWNHATFVTAGFVVPFAICTYVLYLVGCGVQLESPKGGGID